jgi:hypothetical protein
MAFLEAINIAETEVASMQFPEAGARRKLQRRLPRQPVGRFHEGWSSEKVSVRLDLRAGIGKMEQDFLMTKTVAVAT